MRLFFLPALLVCAALLNAAPPAQAEARLAEVMADVRADRWEEARAWARAIGPVAGDIVEWRRLRAGDMVGGRDALSRAGEVSMALTIR